MIDEARPDPAAVKVKIHDPERLPDLMAVLAARIDTIVEQTADDELEVSVLDSRHVDASAAELEARLLEWGGGAHVVRLEARRRYD